jgi:lysophospholipase L1-like esterase
MATPALSPETFAGGDSGPLKSLPETGETQVFAAPQTERHVLLTKPAWTIFCVLLLGLLPLGVPSLAPYREYWPNFRDFVTFNGGAAGNLNDVPGGTADASAAVVLPPAPEGSGELEDPKASLIPFYKALAATDAKQPQAITRIIHYGDSPICADLITGTTRRKLQERFGDAGHGFLLASRPWEWYVHDGIEFASTEWSHHPMLNGKLPDGMFGLGGVASRALGAGQISRYAPTANAKNGVNNSRMEVYYLKQPNGGSFVMNSSDGQPQTVNTADTKAASGFAELKTNAPGPHSFEIKSVGGNVRLFGAVLENDNPGVVYDSMGVTGAYAGLLAVQMNEQNWAEQLQHRKPNLIILNYGTNESQYDSPENFATYETDLREVVRRIRAAVPETAILIMSPMDRGRRNGGAIITHPAIPKIVAMQRRVAQETGCAFFDTFTAMGGEGTIARWYAGVSGERLVGGDLMHPKPRGAELVGTLVSDALTKGYERYQSAVNMAAARKK